MALGPKALVYIAAAAALAIGASAYVLTDAGDEHEEEGLLEGDAERVAVVGVALAAVAAVSYAYLAKSPPPGK